MSGQNFFSIPTARLRPIVEEWMSRSEARTAKALAQAAGVDQRSIHRLMKEADQVSFDLADRVLVAMGRIDLWYVELADLLPAPLVVAEKTAAEQLQRAMTDSELAAVQTLCRHGLTLAQIARRCYRKLDFPSAEECECAFRRAFDLESLPARRTASRAA